MVLLLLVGVETEEGVGRFCQMLSANQASVLPGVITASSPTTQECV